MAKLPKIKTIRTKCDNLLTPITIAKHPQCFLRGAKNCAGVSQVGHHHIRKSNSSNLRYDLDNLIPLCTPCHMALHQNETRWTPRLIQIKGTEWHEELVRKGQVMVKTDVHFYIKHYERLKEIYETN